MKELIIVLLLSFCFCNINELEKYGSIKVTEEDGLIYLNTEDFSYGDKLYIEFISSEGIMYYKIFYEFNDNIPNDSDYYPYLSMTPSSNSVTYGIGIDTTYTYYYHIRKNENHKYLLIRYVNFSGKYLEVEHNKMTVIGLVFLIIGIVFVAIILIVAIIITIVVIKNKRKKNDYMKFKEKNEQKKDIFYEPNA